MAALVDKIYYIKSIEELCGEGATVSENGSVWFHDITIPSFLTGCLGRRVKFFNQYILSHPENKKIAEIAPSCKGRFIAYFARECDMSTPCNFNVGLFE